MRRRVSVPLFVALAVTTGVAIQCGTPVVESLVDAGLDGDLFDSDIPDARADVDIPEGCDCEAPLIALDDRLEALEARVAELEPAPPPDPDTFSMLIGFDGATPSELLVPYSAVYAGCNFNYIGPSGSIVDFCSFSVSGYHPATRSRVSFSIRLPSTVETGDTFELTDDEADIYFFTSDVSGDDSGMSCSVYPSLIAGMSATGRLVVSRFDDRMVGTFTASLVNTSSVDPCSATITEGRFDAVLAMPNPTGEYVNP